MKAVQVESPSMNSTVQRSLTFDESGERFPGISLVEEEVPDQPWLNSSPMLRALPPEVTTLVVRKVPARFSPSEADGSVATRWNMQLVACSLRLPKQTQTWHCVHQLCQPGSSHTLQGNMAWSKACRWFQALAGSCC